MIELAFVACLLAQPQICTAHSLLFDDRLGLRGCTRISQAELSRWTEAHPGRRVVRYSCRYPGAKETRVAPAPLTGSEATRAQAMAGLGRHGRG